MMRTLGTQIVSARVNELRRVLLDLSVDDMSQLDPHLAAVMDHPLGRELLAATLPVSDSVFICLYNLEPSGLMVLHRSDTAARIRALAISPDMRRKGLARTLLIEAEQRARNRHIEWLWMQIPAENVAATKCARERAFRRYCPQFLRREHGTAIPMGGIHIQLDAVRGSESERLVLYWLSAEVSDGDAWVQPLVLSDLMPVLIPSGGQVWRLSLSGNEIGCAHSARVKDHPIITLWLDSGVWGTPAEFACLRTVLNTLKGTTAGMDVRLGSDGHLRSAVPQYKEYGFAPTLDTRVLFVKRIAFLDE